MTWLIGAAGFAAIIGAWLYAPTVRDRLTRERRDAIERHSRDRGEGKP